jgi:hypothetical protein
MSAFMRKIENADSRNEVGGSSGYDVPVHVSLRSKTRPVVGVSREAAGGEGQDTLLMGQSADEVTRGNSSPPPTYSQLFSTTSMTISTGPCSSSTCTHNQLHVAKEHGERSDDDDRKDDDDEEGGCRFP